MKSLFALIIVLFAFTLGFAQNEQAPIVEKDVKYKNWTYKDVRSGAEVSLRDLTAGKKLVVVVYFAPWCPNWKHDAPFLQRFYDQYKLKGLEIVGVGEYDPVAAMATNLDTLKVTFPVVSESTDRSDREKTLHHKYRESTGDNRKWGSPWYILLDPASLEKKGDTLVKRSAVINGEMVQTEGEKFIREKLGLPAMDPKAASAKSDKIEVCDPDKPGDLKLQPVKKP